MNFEKIYSLREDTPSGYNVKYEQGSSGPFEEILGKYADREPNHNGTNKPAVKGTHHFDYEKAKDQNNKPSCPYKNDDYEVKYGGKLNENNADKPALDILMEGLRALEQKHN